MEEKYRGRRSRNTGTWVASLVRLCTSSSITQGRNERIEERFRDFQHIGFVPRYSKSRISRPQILTHKGEGIGESGERFGIPSGLARSSGRMSGVEGMSNQGHPREQTQQQRRGTGNRFVRPLALGFHAQMTTGFFKSDFQLPALDKPSDDRTAVRSGRVGTQQTPPGHSRPAGRAPTPNGSAAAVYQRETRRHRRR